MICELLGIPVADRGWIWVTVTDDLLSSLVLAHDNADEDGAEAALTTTELLSAG